MKPFRLKSGKCAKIKFKNKIDGKRINSSTKSSYLPGVLIWSNKRVKDQKHCHVCVPMSTDHLLL